MPFQESAESIKAKAHISSVKTPVAIGIAALTILTVLVVLLGVWDTFSSSSFEIQKAGSSEAGSDRGDQDVEGASQDEAAAVKTITVHIGGAVRIPGVYLLPEGARVQGAVDAAGGFTEEADSDSNNLARILTDGEQVIIPNKTSAENFVGAEPGTLSTNTKVNINSATSSELATLPGIGEATAKKIIANREANGPFRSIEDLKRVSGIGEKKYADLASLICV